MKTFFGVVAICLLSGCATPKNTVTQDAVLDQAKDRLCLDLGQMMVAQAYVAAADPSDIEKMERRFKGETGAAKVQVLKALSDLRAQMPVEPFQFAAAQYVRCSNEEGLRVQSPNVAKCMRMYDLESKVLYKKKQGMSRENTISAMVKLTPDNPEYSDAVKFISRIYDLDPSTSSDIMYMDFKGCLKCERPGT